MAFTAGGRFLAGTAICLGPTGRWSWRRWSRDARVLNLPLSNSLVVGSSDTCCSRDEQDVLVSKLVIDVTDFSRPGVAALRYSHSS